MLKSKTEDTGAQGTPALTRDVANFIEGVRSGDLSPEVVEAAKKAFLDCLGVAIAGALAPAGKIIRDFVKESDAKPVSTVIGGGFRTSPDLAALANGTMAHALDYDDGGALPIPFHPSVPVLPVVLSLGEQQKSHGNDVLLAYIVGMEVETKIAAIVPTSHFTHGWHPTATIGTLGATAAAAKLLKLNAVESEVALGIAASLAGGIRLNFGTMTKPLHAGNASRNGIVAAFLAKKRFSSAPNALEAHGGFLDVFTEKWRDSQKTKGFKVGEPFHFAYPGVAMKKYPSCRGTHASIGALSEILKKQRPVPQEIDYVDCTLSSLSEGDNNLSRPHARTSEEGKFSIEHCLSVLLLDGEIGLSQFSLERILDPVVDEMRQKIQVRSCIDLLPENERRSNLAARITVRLRNGEEFSHFFCQSKEDMGVPWSWEDITKKFKQCASLALPAKKVGELTSLVRNIEKLESISKVVELVSGATNR